MFGALAGNGYEAFLIHDLLYVPTLWPSGIIRIMPMSPEYLVAAHDARGAFTRTMAVNLAVATGRFPTSAKDLLPAESPPSQDSFSFKGIKFRLRYHFIQWQGKPWKICRCIQFDSRYVKVYYFAPLLHCWADLSCYYHHTRLPENDLVSVSIPLDVGITRLFRDRALEANVGACDWVVCGLQQACSSGARA